MKEPFFRIYYQFFKQLRHRYGRKLIFTDGALWYNDACKWLLRLNHQIYGTELKNLMERFIQYIKDRTECVLMIIFHVENQTVIDNNMSLELAQNVCTVLAYGNGQETIYYLLG